MRRWSLFVLVTGILLASVGAACADEKEGAAQNTATATLEEAEPIDAEPAHTAEPAAEALTFEIAGREDVSFGATIRIVYRVTVSGALSKSELRRIAQEIIDEETSQHDVNAIAFFFYLPGTDTTGVYTAGKADWAPHGDWAQASDVVTGDYSEHELVVEAEPVFEPIESSESLTEDTKREIFREAVRMENELGLFTSEIEPILAERYGISPDEVGDIIIEGITKGWPAPW